MYSISRSKNNYARNNQFFMIVLGLEPKNSLRITKYVFFTAKNNILRRKMTLTDNGSTQFLARVCPRAKPLEFDPLPPSTGVLKH